jgi:hypothetical protein
MLLSLAPKQSSGLAGLSINLLLGMRLQNRVIPRPVFAERRDPLSCFAYVAEGANQHSLAVR